MNTKRIRRLLLAVSAAATLTAMSFGGIPAAAAESSDTVTVNVTGTYGQTEARSMLDMINDFRTGDEASYWNKDNETKTVYNTTDDNMLSPLQYDYALEEIAMQRAMEIAIQNNHVRPKADPDSKSENDKVFPLIKALSSTYRAAGENIAAGYSTASSVFEGWQETDDDYSGQGHRRNMLNPDFTAVGIGHVMYNGSHYWVQVFRAPTVNTIETPVNDSKDTKSVEILESNIIDSEVNPSISSLVVPYGDSVGLPEIKCEIQLNKTWPEESLCPVSIDPASINWSIEGGGDRISIDESGRIVGKSCGTATLATTVLGEPFTLSVEVMPKPLDDAFITLASGTEQEYTGAEIKPEVTVELSGMDLQPDEDYTVSYSDNTNVGTATVTVTGIGNYTGEKTTSFEITKAHLTEESSSISVIEDQPYTGSAIEPQVTVTHNDVLLSSDDYNVSYTGNTNVGTAAVTVTGEGNYDGTISSEFQITAIDVSDCSVDEIPDQEYSGEEIIPEINLQWNDLTLTNEDFDLSFSSNTEVGKASVTVTGKGNFTGERSLTFNIIPADLSAAEADISPQIYTGSDIEPELTVVLKGKELASGTDYTVTYENNVNAGQASATVHGQGNYTGEKTFKFEIEPLSLPDTCEVAPIDDQPFTGGEISPEIQVIHGSDILTPEEDYTVSYEDNVNAGNNTAAATVNGIGNYSGSITVKFTILPQDINDNSVQVTVSEQTTFTGEEIEALTAVTWKDNILKENVDYEVSYSNNINAGTADMTLSGIGNYTGERTESFKILKADIANCTVDAIPDLTYTGEEICPDLTVSLGNYELKPLSDFTVSYANNTKISTEDAPATATLLGNGNFTGRNPVTFHIVPIDLEANGGAIESISDHVYDGVEFTPAVTVTLKGTPLSEGDDYTVSYSDNKNAGEATVTVTGCGIYSGSITGTFRITAKTLTSDDCTIVPIQDKTYTGGAITPPVTVMYGEKTLSPDIDYTLAYENNQNAGDATVTVTAVGNYSGKLGTVSFRIIPADLADCTVGAIADQAYTGSAITPPVEVRLGEVLMVQDKDYTVSYEHNTEPGLAAATLKGIGSLTGTCTVNFTITAPATPTPSPDSPVPSATPDTSSPVNPVPGTTPDASQDSPIPGVTPDASPDNPVPDASPDSPTPGTTPDASSPVNPTPGTTPDASSPVNPVPGTTPGTSSPVSPVPDTTPGITSPDVPAPTPAVPSVTPPKKGTVQKDAATGAKYRVSGNSVSGVTVEYLAPTNSKKTSVNIPAVVSIKGVPCKVTSIAPNAFKNNKKLKKVAIGKNVTSIGKDAFRGCAGLTTVKINSKTSVIASGAFYGCTSLKNITIPARVISIGRQAFYKCSNLKRILIKTKRLTAKSVGKQAFAKISSKAVITVPAGRQKAYSLLLKKKGLRSGIKVR